MNHWLNLTLTILTHNFGRYDFFIVIWEPPMRICNSFGLFPTSYMEKIRIFVLYSKHLRAETIKKEEFSEFFPTRTRRLCGIDKHTVYSRVETLRCCSNLPAIYVDFFKQFLVNAVYSERVSPSVSKLRFSALR